MTDVGGAMAAAEVLAGDPRRGDPAAKHLQDSEAHGVCANCDTPLTGPHCAQCGQRAHLHSRLRDLFHEAVEGILHFDGRMWRTLPLLASNPGRLSREWREGRRVRYLQPLHLFLFALFLFFTLPALTGRHLINLPAPDEVNSRPAAIAVGEIDRDRIGNRTRLTVDESSELGQSIGSTIRKRLENKEYYAYKIESLAYKLGFLLVPISMLILAGLMVFRRGYSFYDHGVVSLYGIGFAILCATVWTALSAFIGVFGLEFSSLFFPVIWLALAAHAIAHLKGAYALSWLGAVIRGLLLCVLTLIGFSIFLFGVIALGLLA